MTSHLRSFLTAAGILIAAAAFQPALHAQGFGGMFSGFKMNNDSDDKEEKTTHITADAADIDMENNIITLLGNVDVDDGTNKITCNNMKVFLKEETNEPADGEKSADAAGKKDEKPAPAPAAVAASGKTDAKADDGEEDDSPKKSITKIICTGDVVYTKRSEKPGQDQIAMSDRAEYDADREVIVMTGDPSLNERRAQRKEEDLMPVLKQGTSKMACDKIEILIREGNRMRVTFPDVHYTGDSILSSPAKKGSDL